MTQQRPIALGVKSALAAGLITVPFTATNAIAEEQQATAPVERIAVTGSRIKRQDMETASPVTTIGAEQIAAGSYTSVEQILQETTASAGAAIGSATNNGGRGVANVDLRGMGAKRTLVLVNGRRMVNSGTGADASVDLNTIPVAMIERIEVLKDGASAVYGSDAIAGVINIITKQDFDGFQIDAQAGMSDKGDGETGELNLLFGKNYDRGNFVVGATYVNRGEVMQDSRFWSNCGPVGDCGGWSSTIPGGTINWGDGWHQPDGSGGFKPQEDKFNYVPYSYLSTPQERFSLTANGKYELSDNVTGFTELLYTKRQSAQQMAPAPVTGVVIPNEILPEGPWGDKDIEYRRRMSEAGPRTFEQDTDTYRIVVGLEGYLDVGRGIDWDLSYNYGRNDAVSYANNLVQTSKMLESVGSNPLEWMSGDPLSQETLDYIMYNDRSEGGNEMQVANLNFSGELFDMPAGPVAFAAGAEYRKESGYFTPDAVTQAGDSSQSQQDPTAGGYDTSAVYAEFSIPLLADMKYAQEVTAEAAVRAFNYSTFGSDATWKLGLTWKVNEQVMFRSVASTAFRAPSISELYGGNVGSFDYLNDPCWGYGANPDSPYAASCAASGLDPSYGLAGDGSVMDPDSQIEVTWTSGNDLQPEQAETYTIGTVLSPTDNLSLTFDYWQFKVENAIVRIDRQAYLNGCYSGNDEMCDVLNIERSDVSGQISYMEAPLVNAGYQNTSGVDMNLSYKWNYGGHDWMFNWDVTRLLEFEQDGIDYTGTLSGMNGAYAEWRQNANLMVRADDWTLSYSVRMIGEMRDLETPDFQVPAAWYHNVSYMYHINRNLDLTVGINNIFDETPKYTPSYSDVYTVPEVYDVMGRYIFTKLSYRF
ncbi:TonB-dependent receptor [Paraferrimonas sedimenticola]|uniref:TonB-dependent receptor n=1 Tax=Paraferrimonas sedimenticola TaxID=375674 RepID=A0AA37RVK0_9GAMM|nr:TonB-dependent receptor [Paraferrimonas sedimenticola]GLP96156.1 TonB-dependent receptor [Paraferrimonas sedimenticola]